MEKKGFICRESVTRDARLKKVSLTDKGIQTHEEMTKITEQMDDFLLRGVGKEDLKIFLGVIRKIRENAEKGEMK